MSLIRFAGGWLVFVVIALIYLFALALLNLRRAFAASKRSKVSSNNLRVLVTGRVNSINWGRSHLLPLAQASSVQELIAAMDGPSIEHPKIRPARPPASLGKILPRALARSISFFPTAWREKPEIIIGYSFFPGALFGLLAARMTGAVAIYNITGGLEISGGGIAKEHRFAHVPDKASAALTPLVARLCRHFDAIIVRGQKTKNNLIEQIRPRRVEVIAGSVDSKRFGEQKLCSSRREEAHSNSDGKSQNLLTSAATSASETTSRKYEVVFLGRVVAIKQPEHLLEVLVRVVKKRPNLRAIIAGDGPLLPSIKTKAVAMGLEKNIEFPGHVERIEEILPRSKIFLLTSKSEGLSIALAEAMIAGAVPVVADVGDLGELVKNAETGWLIPPGDFDAYAERILQLLENEMLWQQLSRNAHRLAMNNNALENVTERWEDLFAALTKGDNSLS